MPSFIPISEAMLSRPCLKRAWDKRSRAVLPGSQHLTSACSAFVCTWWSATRRPSGDAWIKALIEALEQHVTAALAYARQRSSLNCSLVTGSCRRLGDGHAATAPPPPSRHTVTHKRKCVSVGSYLNFATLELAGPQLRNTGRWRGHKMKPRRDETVQ